MMWPILNAASLHLLDPIRLVERPESWPVFKLPADDAKYFVAGDFSVRGSWTLYANESGPDPSDVYQRDLGECWLAASLKAVAAIDKTAITKSIVRLNDTQFVFHTIVRLNETVFVPIEMAVDASVTDVKYTKSLDIRMSSQQEAIIWQSVIEKAIAKIFLEYCIPFGLPCAHKSVGTERSLDVLDNNVPAMILTMLTKTHYVYVSPRDLSDDDIIDLARMAEHRPIVITTMLKNSCSMVRKHGLWLKGLDEQGLLIVQNPFKDSPSSHTVSDFRRQVGSLSIPATYQTRAGRFPPYGHGRTEGWHMCNGDLIDNVKSAVWYILVFLALPLLAFYAYRI